jgi:hypothetical protein
MREKETRIEKEEREERDQNSNESQGKIDNPTPKNRKEEEASEGEITDDSDEESDGPDKENPQEAAEDMEDDSEYATENADTADSNEEAAETAESNDETVDTGRRVLKLRTKRVDYKVLSTKGHNRITPKSKNKVKNTHPVAMVKKGKGKAKKTAKSNL